MMNNQNLQGAVDLRKIPTFEFYESEQPSAAQKKLNDMIRAGWSVNTHNVVTSFDPAQGKHITVHVIIFVKVGGLAN